MWNKRKNIFKDFIQFVQINPTLKCKNIFSFKYGFPYELMIIKTKMIKIDRISDALYSASAF